MNFLQGAELNEAVRKLLKQPKAKCAVAFWGKGAEKWLKKDARVICNLTSGGTNPNVIEKIAPENRRQCNTLHAKVYLAGGKAIVTSANASANGLGFEGREASQWIETGVEMIDAGEIGIWFEKLWLQSDKISATDIDEAKKNWGFRQHVKPSRLSLNDANLSGPDMPLIMWVGGAQGYTICEESVKNQVGSYSDDIKRQIDFGIQIDGEADRRALKLGRWILCWELVGNDGHMRKRSKPYWFQCGQTIEDGFQYDDQPKPQAICIEAVNSTPPPFEVSSSEFRNQFSTLLVKKDYRELRSYDYEGAFLTSDRLTLMKAFWSELRDGLSRA